MSFVERPEAHKIYSNFIDPTVCDETIDYINSFEKSIKNTPYNCKVFTSDNLTHNILNDIIFYRTLPLIIIVPIGVSLGTKLFAESSKKNYRKYVLYFLITVSVFGLLQIMI